jgi:glucose/arabinose dehydrogenase
MNRQTREGAVFAQRGPAGKNVPKWMYEMRQGTPSNRLRRNRPAAVYGQTKDQNSHPSQGPIRLAVLTLLLAVLAEGVPLAWGQVVVPFGYRIDPAVTGGLNRPTAMAEDSGRRLYITQFGPGGGSAGVKIVLPANPATARDFATVPQLDRPAGIVVDGTRVLISNRASGVDLGQIVEYVDRNGNLFIDDPSEFRIVISDLPQGVNGTRALVQGLDGRLYVGQGSITSSSATEPTGINAKVFSFSLDSPLTKTVFASGFFNPLGIAFEPGGRAFITDRSPVLESWPDELNLAAQGEYFGFARPTTPGAQPKAPLVAFPQFSSPAGVAYFPPSEFTGDEEVVFVALEGHPAGLPEPAPKVVRVVLHRQGQEVTAEFNDFVVGLEQPFGLLKVTLGTGAEALLISDFGANVVYRVRLRTPTDPPDFDVDRSGQIDNGDILVLMKEWRSGVPEHADFNEDGQINAHDLYMLANNWEGDFTQ